MAVRGRARPGQCGSSRGEGRVVLLAPPPPPPRGATHTCLTRCQVSVPPSLLPHLTRPPASRPCPASLTRPPHHVPSLSPTATQVSTSPGFGGTTGAASRLVPLASLTPRGRHAAATTCTNSHAHLPISICTHTIHKYQNRTQYYAHYLFRHLTHTMHSYHQALLYLWSPRTYAKIMHTAL